MSFFDEADESPRRPPRSEPRQRRPSGRGGPPRNQQSIQARRIIAAFVVLVVIVLAALGIHSCQVTQTDNSLKDYNTSVRVLIAQSNTTGDTVYKLLSSRASTSNEDQLALSLHDARNAAASQLSSAQNLSVPGAMSTAQQNLVLALQMRRDAIATIGEQIEAAVGTTTREAAIDAIASAGSQIFASDVIYKDYVLPEIVGALQAAGIAVGGANGQVLNGGQVISDLGWLNPSFISTELGLTLPSSASSHPFVAGLHGHSLNSVSVSGVTLSPSPASNSPIPSSPPPTFTLKLTNGGDFDEYNVVCKVSISNLSDTGSSTIAETTPNETTTCPVTLPSAPTPGSYTVTAEVVPVEGESNTANNYLKFSITFS